MQQGKETCIRWVMVGMLLAVLVAGYTKLAYTE